MDSIKNFLIDNVSEAMTEMLNGLRISLFQN